MAPNGAVDLTVLLLISLLVVSSVRTAESLADHAVAPPAVLVFENTRYQQTLAAAIGDPTALELVDCAAPGS
jgi:hypothetical protein